MPRKVLYLAGQPAKFWNWSPFSTPNLDKYLKSYIFYGLLCFLLLSKSHRCLVHKKNLDKAIHESRAWAQKTNKNTVWVNIKVF